MGMRIQGGGGGYASGPQDAQWQQRRQNFDALAQAIAGGDLANANDAMSKITSSLPSGAQTNPDSFIGKIGAALQSGDITSAQQLLTARINGAGDQSGSASPIQLANAATASNAASATSATTGTSAAVGSHGRHHHHHGGGGGSSPALDLSQAIQSGDTAKAKSSMQTLLTDLQQVADMGNLATPGMGTTTTNSTVSTAISAANNLLQNPDFQAMEDAVTKGDSTAMQSAWAKLISANADSSSAAATATATATIA